MLLYKSAYILGYSGHSYVILDSLEKLNIEVRGYFDFEPCSATKNFYNLKYKGNERLVDLNIIDELSFVFPAIGDNGIRKKLVEFIEDKNLPQSTIIDLQAIVSKSALIESSVYVAPGAIINSQTVIRKGCIINSGATIEHECSVGKYSHIAPNAVLTGNVEIGENTLIGANAVVLPGLKIGNNVVVGAGAVVTKNISSNSKWIGNPLREL